MRTLKKNVYRHYKTGDLYRIITFATHTEDSEMLVIYTKLIKRADNYDDWRLWARPYSIFYSYVLVAGKLVKRFQPATDYAVLAAYLDHAEVKG